jgi:Gly-Xaa carboxypeptidase
MYSALMTNNFPAHTSIGLLALAIVLLEANPHKPHLSRMSPFYTTMVCVAEHAPDVPKNLRKLILESLHSEPALREIETILLNGHAGKRIGSLLGTTQAVDLVEGGVKVNALPERASAVVNHRISVERCAKPVVRIANLC